MTRRPDEGTAYHVLPLARGLPHYHEESMAIAFPWHCAKTPLAQNAAMAVLHFLSQLFERFFLISRTLRRHLAKELKLS